METIHRVIREACKADAEAFLTYLKTIGGESDNLTIDEKGLSFTIEQESEFLDTTAQSHNTLCLLSLEGDTIIGSLSLTAPSRPRVAHCAEMGISVLQAYWGQGVASALMEKMLNWAKNPSTGIRKIELKVRVDNQRAIDLYRRFSFVEEGRVFRMLFIDGQFHDGLSMALLLD